RSAEGLAAAEGLEGVAALQGEALVAALEERFRAATVEEWVRRLTAADVGAHRVVNSPDAPIALDYARQRGLTPTRAPPSGGTVTSTGPAPRLSRTPVRAGEPAPVLGAHSREVLAEVGLDARTDALIAAGGVVEA